MEFMIGCNYWASNAGTEMWRNWDEAAVREDMEILSAHGIRYLRVFPNWRDFQPVIPLMQGQNVIEEYRLEGDRLPENSYYIDEVMLERFSRFCEICEEYGMKLIVGLVTGWMSGRLFIPAALFGKNLYTDPVAQYFQQKLVTGIVRRMKHHTCIWAWDLGNECNVMDRAGSEYETENWTAMIANAIRASDPDRPIVSGMTGMYAENDERRTWSIRGQAEHCDYLTTHPYPFWSEHATQDQTLAFRTLLHASGQTKYFADLGHKPCFTEEIGTMGPMICSDRKAAEFMRCNLFLNWANGSNGVLWWCANEQTNLTTNPYTKQMCEIELGMIYADRTPKPVLKETARIAGVLRSLPFELPPATEDAVCLLTQGQDQWGAAYMTWCLTKQAGLQVRFAYCKDVLPESKLYIIPSACGHAIMPRDRYQELKQRVREGATLYVSNDSGIWAEFEELTGLEVQDSCNCNESLTVELSGVAVAFRRKKRRYEIKATTAEVLAYDSLGLPAVTEHANGSGKVYYVNFPLETILLEEDHAFDGNTWLIYRELFGELVERHAVRILNPQISLTLHPAQDGSIYCVAVNCSAQTQRFEPVLREDVRIEEIYYGAPDEIPPMEAVIFKVTGTPRPSKG